MGLFGRVSVTRVSVAGVAILAVVAAMALVVGPSPALAGPSTVAATPVCSGSADTENSAREMAVACNRRVEVRAATSGRSQVFAEPSGAFTFESTLTTQRVQRADGSWVPVDRTLRRLADGTFAPVATAAEVRFSSGGSGPFVSWQKDGHRFTLSWPTPLPAPVVEGDSVTYLSILDGVDLVVTATENGFRHVLVVHTAQGAANPRIRDIRYGFGGDVRPVVAADGAVTLVGPDGRMFAAAGNGALMWDSGAPSPGQGRSATTRVLDVDPPGPRSSAHAPVGTARVGRVRAAVIGSELALRPTPESFTGDYPLYIDPDYDAGAPAWAYSNSDDDPETMQDTTLQTGESPSLQLWTGLDPVVNRVYRGYLRFNTLPIAQKHILGAHIDALVDHNYHCTGNQNVYLYVSAIGFGASGSLITPHTASSIPGTLIDYFSVTSANEESCATTNKAISFGSGVAGVMQYVADNSGTAATFILSAASNTAGAGETFTARWMRFNMNYFKLIVNYNTPPTLGALSTTPATTCVTLDSGPSPSRPFVSTTPTLKAVANDGDAGDNDLRTVFEWQQWAGSAWGTTSSGQQTNIPPGGIGQVTPSTLLNATYRWRVRVEDPWTLGGSSGVDVSAWSVWCQFEVDTQNPAVPTVIEPTDFDSLCTCGSVGVAGRLTFSSSPDVTSFRWGTTNPPTTVATATMGAPVTVWFTPTAGGPTSIHVQAIDRAGNLSGVFTHGFTVPPPTPNIGRWLQIDELGGLNLNDSSGAPTLHDLTLAGGDVAAPSRVVGEPALGLRNSPLAGEYASTASAVLNTPNGFTVSAWVRLTTAPSSSYFPTVLSQSGGAYAAIELQAQPGGWCLNARNLGGNPATSSAVCGGTVKLNVWTHVAAVHDHNSGRFRIYVNGAKVADAAHGAPSASSGSLAIGRSTLAGAVAELVTGEISDVRVWQRVVYDSEIAEMVLPTLVGKWRFGELIPPEQDESGHFHHLDFSGPGVTVPLPAQGIDGTGLVLDGSGNAFTESPVIRTDQSFTVSAWVRPTDFDGFKIVASQDGTYLSSFYLEYSPDGYWDLAVSSADSSGGVGWTYAISHVTPVLGQWTHLVGLYDAPARQLRIYVNGVLGDVANNVTVWNAPGSFRVGGSIEGDNFVGAIDEFRVYAGVVPVWVGDWRFGTGSCTGTPATCADAAVIPHPVQLAGGAAPTANGRYGSGLTFPTVGGATTTGPVVDTSKSFTVAAWVKLATTGGNRTAVSQYGTSRSAFQLGYQTADDNLCFTVAHTDTGSSPTTRACGTGAVPMNQWVHLIGIYDAVAGTITLHIDGGAAAGGQSAVKSFNNLWSATGPLAIGRGGSASSPGAQWLGDIDEVRVHQGVVSDLSLLF